MKKLSVEEDTKIRNRLDHIAHNLYHNVTIYEDMAWSHKTIKDLLYIIDELQEGVKGNGEKTG